MGRPPTLQEALFWKNLYRDLLAGDENTLLRMQALLLEDAALRRGADSYDEDVELVIRSNGSASAMTTGWPWLNG